MSLAAAVQDIVDLLTAAGIRATQDLRDLNPPAVYVPPPVISWRVGKGTADAVWTMAAVVPATGRKQSLANLGPLIAAVTAVLPQIVTGRPIDLQGIDSTGPCPAYELTMTTRIDMKESTP